jgi:selenocysteine lyase/cysteine desulfurase
MARPGSARQTLARSRTWASARSRIAVGANGPAYTPLDVAARGLAGVVRASVSYLNTEEEAERLADAVRMIGEGAGA